MRNGRSNASNTKPPNVIVLDIHGAEVKPVKPEQIDALMPFLSKFEEAGFSVGTWNTEPGHLPRFNFDEVVMEFIHVLYDNDWITPEFDWVEWQKSAQQFIESPEKIESADSVTIQKLLTTHARKDRFCEGHLASMFEDGHIPPILRRLQVLRAEMDRDGSHE